MNTYYAAANRATAAAPQDPLAWAFVGRAAFYADLMEEAKAAYERVRELAPDFIEQSEMDKEIVEALKDIP